MKTVHYKEYRREHTILSSPMTKEELKDATRKDGTIKVKISIPFNEIVEESKDGVESDIATAITKDPEGLYDMTIELAGREKFRAILNVTAKVYFDAL